MCQWIIIITIYKMSNASGCCPVAKSHQDHWGSQSEQFRIFRDVLRRSFCLKQSAPAFGLTHGCVTPLSDSQGCELSDFAHVLQMLHNGTGIKRSQRNNDDSYSTLLREQIWCSGKFFTFDGLKNVILKWIWCGCEGRYDDFICGTFEINVAAFARF